MAKTVYVGSARSDENGKANSGKAGDQKQGKEVSTQAWYKHSKGWRVFRAKDPVHALMIAKIMRWACVSDLIGYDQYQRNTLYNELEKVGFGGEPQLSKAVETDCSALVRVCLAFCGIDVPAEFRTANMAQYMLDTGMFVELKGSKYTDQPDYLGEGDILVTQTSGHTVVVLDNGDLYEGIGSVDASEPDGDLKVKPGSWRIRSGPGTEYATVDYVRTGDTLVSVNAEGWVPVLYKEQVRWISKNALEE